MKNENIEIKSNENVSLELTKITDDVSKFTRKDWFAVFYKVFQVFENNEKLYDYRDKLMSAIADATDVIVAKNRYEKDDDSVA